MARVDLVFGAGRVSPAAWSAFLASVVTPRFPAGFTSLEAQGQWRGPRGLVLEPSRIIVVYLRRTAVDSAKIDEIRTIYKARFAQASVLRADSVACVSF